VCIKQDGQHYYYQTQTTTTVDSVIRDLTEIFNQRVLLAKLLELIRTYVSSSTQPPSSSDPVTSTDSKTVSSKPNSSPSETADLPSSSEAVVVTPDARRLFENVVSETEAVISNKRGEKRDTTSVSEVTTCMATIRVAAKTAFNDKIPPAFEQLMADSKANDDSKVPDWIVWKADKTSVWFCSKELGRDLTLAAASTTFASKNEKCYATFVLQKKGSGPPPRLQNPDEIRAIVQMHQKQQQTARQEPDHDTSYLNSAWANPNALKLQSAGLGPNIRWK